MQGPRRRSTGLHHQPIASWIFPRAVAAEYVRSTIGPMLQVVYGSVARCCGEDFGVERVDKFEKIVEISGGGALASFCRHVAIRCATARCAAVGRFPYLI